MRSRTPYVLTLIAIALMVASSVTPLCFDLYARDPAFAKGAQLGTDLVTLALGAPLLLIGMIMAARRSVIGTILWIGMLEYTFYAFIYYLLGARMNELLPVYTLLCVLPLYALIQLTAKPQMAELGAHFARAAHARLVAVWMVFFALLLAVVWLVQWYLVIFAKWDGGGLPNEALHLIFAVDLTVFVPAFLVIAVLLWRKTSLGFAHAAAAMVMGTVYPLVLIASAPFQDKLGVPGAWTTVPLWAFLSLGSFISAVALLRHVRK